MWFLMQIQGKSILSIFENNGNRPPGKLKIQVKFNVYRVLNNNECSEKGQARKLHENTKSP